MKERLNKKQTDSFLNKLDLRDQESVMDSILEDWRSEIKKNKNKNLNKKFFELHDSFLEFTSELTRLNLI